MDDKIKEEILMEQRFPYENMTKEERDFYLRVLSNCKDIIDSENKVNNSGKCSIVQMYFNKRNDIVHCNGFLTLEGENRCLDADIFKTNKKLVVDMLITRLMVNDSHKEYRVSDEFSIEKDKLKRNSTYNYDMKSKSSIVEDEYMKGRLK